MESGFDRDPAFEIIWMPDAEDKEKDGISLTETTETDAHVAGSADSRDSVCEFDRDSAK